MPPLPPDPLVGAVLDGRWHVSERVDAGAFGTVYRGERAKLGRRVGIKVLHEDFCESTDFVIRFEREARAISRLNHIHCVSILDFGLHAGRPFIVMEFVPGRRLTVEIGRPEMTPARAIGIIKQMLLGLRHAHKHGVLHRDLKPDNVMLAEVTGSLDFVKILDFGFAQLLDQAEATHPGRPPLVAGTPSYMAPEQALSEKTDARTDLYSTGVMLYELVVGRKPFSHTDPLQTLAMHVQQPPPRPRHVAPERMLSEELEAVMLRALAKSRDDRFADAAAFLAALEATPEALEAQQLALGVPPLTTPPALARQRARALPRLFLASAFGAAAACAFVMRTDRISQPARAAAVVAAPPHRLQAAPLVEQLPITGKVVSVDNPAAAPAATGVGSVGSIGVVGLGSSGGAGGPVATGGAGHGAATLPAVAPAMAAPKPSTRPQPGWEPAKTNADPGALQPTPTPEPPPRIHSFITKRRKPSSFALAHTQRQPTGFRAPHHKALPHPRKTFWSRQTD
jgi:hypothetical protein